MEENALYQQISPLPTGGATNWGAQYTLVEPYFCPSMPLVSRDGETLKQSTYSGVSGPGRDNKELVLETSACGHIATDGMFFPRSRTTFSKITDGTSHTLAVGERTYIFRDWMEGATWSGVPTSLICSGAASNIRYPINASSAQWGYYVGDTEAPSGAPLTMLLNDLYFGSMHPGGAQFCLADGSVHMLLDSLDFAIFQDLATIAGGEVTQLVP
jgi:prepilin-type processing-associated H-X9-DG protein